MKSEQYGANGRVKLPAVSDFPGSDVVVRVTVGATFNGILFDQ